MKRILIAHDLTESGARALERGLSLAALDRAKVTLVHVTENRLLDPDRAILREELRDILETGAKRYPTLTELAVEIASGDRATEIARTAENGDAGLVVVGGHGAMRMRDGLFGTTVERLIRTTERGVLVVRNDPARPYRRLVAAIGGAEAVDETLALAESIASIHEVLAVHAWLPAHRDRAGASDERRRIEELIAHRAAASRLRNVHIHGAALRSDPMTAVMTAFEAIDADLLAIATHARSGFALAWKDSFADLMLEQTSLDLLIRALPR
ncbi:MAG: universal stress protein [Sphingomonadales bacterium]|nr:universal stress protein [Sphingomonadales bacterium]